MVIREETVAVPDGRFASPVWLPESGRGPGILLIQEVFGVDDYIRSVAARFAGRGYVVAAPDMFWRLHPGWRAGKDEASLTASLDLATRFDAERGLADALAALRHLSALPEAAGGLGVVGFCFGGTVAYQLAARADPTATVSFYGSGVPDALDLLDEVDGPLQMHFGGSDPYIERAAVARVQEATAGRPNVEVHVQESAGHAFCNDTNPMFFQPGPAAAAWRLTDDFLARHLPVR